MMGRKINKKGFTLIEMSVAILLLSVGVVALGVTISNHVRVSLNTDIRISALNLAKGSMEHILQYRDYYGYSSALSAINSGSFDDSSVSGFDSFSIDVEADEIDPDIDNSSNDDFEDSQPGSDYARITVQVQFNNGNDYIELETLMADY